MSGRDLVAFGRCPHRWAFGEVPEDAVLADGPSLTEWLCFDPSQAGTLFAKRPATYESMRLECPVCKSEGPAKSCTKCGRMRKNVVRARPWNASAKICAQWLAKAESRRERVIAPGVWDLAEMGAEAMLGDRSIRKLMLSSVHLRTLTGEWHDEATGVTVPVVARGTLVPAENCKDRPALAVYVEARSADPMYWEGAAYTKGLHIEAALLMALWNKVSPEGCREHVWIVVEAAPPRLVARRRASPELLAEGRDRLEELMASYARAVQAGVYPRFEPDGDDTLNSWAKVSLQSWMTSGNGAYGGYFAPSMLLRPALADGKTT